MDGITRLEKPVSLAAISYATSKVAFQMPTNLAIEDALVTMAANFVGEGIALDMIGDWIPNFLSHVSGGVTTGLAYTLLNMWRHSSPFQNEVAQFLYAFAVNETTNNVVLPLLSNVSFDQ